MAAYAKAIAAGVMALLAFLAELFGWSVPGFLTEDALEALLLALAPLIVWLVPNRRSEP